MDQTSSINRSARAAISFGKTALWRFASVVRPTWNACSGSNAAVRHWRLRRTEEALKLDNLRVATQQSVAALDRCEFTEVEDEDLDAYLAA